jgi:hypothetical protein
MTAQEMHDAFKFGLDKFDSLNYPNFEPAEIDLLLNQGQDTFVKQRYGFTNHKKTSFEETQKRTEDLKNIVVRYNALAFINPNNINPDAAYFQLPPDHWLIVQELAEITYPDCRGANVTKKVFVKAIQHNDYSKLIDNPFEKPDKDNVLRLMDYGYVELLAGPGISINGYYLTYIKQPVRINLTNNITCELSDMVHQEVVNTAIQIALEGIEAKRTGTFTPIVESREE